MPSSLIPDGYYPDNLYPQNFYFQFKERINEKKYDTRDIEESFINDVFLPSEFSKEIQTHKIICNMLYFILDSLAPNMEMLTINQRIWLFDHIFNQIYRQPELNIKKNLSFNTAVWYQKNDDPTRIHNIFDPLRTLANLNIGLSGIPMPMKDAFESAIEYAKTDATTNIYEEYEIDSLYQLLYIEILSIIQTKTAIKKCKNCGKYFIVTNQKISYCNRFDKHGILCSDIGSKNTFQKKLANDPALESYNRAYKTHFARMNKGKISKEEFGKWRLLAKEKLELVRTAELELDAYQKWLKE